MNVSIINKTIDITIKQSAILNTGKLYEIILKLKKSTTNFLTNLSIKFPTIPLA